LYWFFEKDNHYCYQFIDEDLCLNEKAPLYGSETMCSWNEATHRCSYRKIEDSLVSVSFVALTISLATPIVTSIVMEIYLRAIADIQPLDEPGSSNQYDVAEIIDDDFQFLAAKIATKRNSLEYGLYRNQFEAAWGIRRTSGKETLPPPQPARGGLSIAEQTSNAVFQRLSEIHSAVSIVIDESDWYMSKLRPSGLVQRSTDAYIDGKVVQHLVMDLIPEYERSVLNAAVKHAEPPIVKVSSRLVAILWNILFLSYLWGTGVFVLYFAYTRMEKIQEIWGFTFLGWFLLDIVLVQTSDAFLRYYWCTNWCKNVVEAASNVIQVKLLTLQTEEEFASLGEDEINPLRMGDASNRLNLVLFSSAQIVAHYLKLGVTQSRAMDLIAKFGSPFPQYPLLERDDMPQRFIKTLKSFFYSHSFIMIIYTRIPPRLGSFLLEQVVVIYWCGVLYLGVTELVGNNQLWHWILLGFAFLCMLWLFSKEILLVCSQWLDGRMDDFIDEDGLIGAASFKARPAPAFKGDDAVGSELTTRDIETTELNPGVFNANLDEDDVEASSEMVLDLSGPSSLSVVTIPNESAVLGTFVSGADGQANELTHQDDLQLQSRGVSTFYL
jgi:hypothetical protein